MPTNTDIAIFDSNSSANCVLASTSLNQLRVESNFAHQLTTASSVAITIADNGGSAGYIEINKASSLAFTSGNIATFAFDKGGLDVYDGAGSQITYASVYVKYGANASVFSDSTSRENCIYSFTDAQEVLLVDGVYPKMVSAGILFAKSITSDVNATAFNTYGSVDILEYRTNGTGTVKSGAHNIYDYDKEFFFESIHSTGIGEFFQFGHTTARFKSAGAHFRLPVLGDVYTNFGNNTTNTFNVQYHKLVIEAGDSASYYCFIQAGHTLDCNELVIRDGGRLYGPAEGHQTPSSKIKSVKRPTIQGDWNFKQIADGIYESIGNIPTLPVTEGGTGLNTVAVNSLLIGQGQLPLTTLAMGSANQVLKVNSGGTALEFATDASGAVSAVANGADNRVATFSSADALNGEAKLTFDGTNLSVDGGITVGRYFDFPSNNTGTGASDPQLRIAGRGDGDDEPGIIQLAQFDGNNFFGGTAARVLGKLQFAMNENSNNVTTVAEIRGITSDPQTAGDFDGALKFFTSQGGSSSASLTEKMILNSDGKLGIGTTSPTGTLHITSPDTATEAIKVTITDTDGTADSTPFVVDGDGRVGIGTASPVADKALTLNGDGTSYEGIAFQTGGSTKYQMSVDSSNFYHDNSINQGGVAFRNRTSGGSLKPGFFLDVSGDAFVHAIGNDDQGGSDMTPMNALQVNVGKAASGVYDKSNGLMIVNNDGSNAADELLAGIGFDSRGGNVPSSVTEASAGILAYASQAHTATEKGGYLTFITSATDDNDDTASHERMRIEADGGVQARKTVIKAVSSDTTLTDADSGKTIYWTGGTLTLPANAEVGQQFVIINNKGSSATPALGTSNAIASGWTSHAAMVDHSVRTYISPVADKWIYIGGN